MSEIKKQGSNIYIIESDDLKMTAWKTSKGWKLDIFSKVVKIGAPTKSFKKLEDLISYEGSFAGLKQLEGN